MPLDRNAVRRRMIDLLEAELAAVGFELLDVRLFAGGGRLSLRVYLDTEGGIDLEGCARASRTIDMLLEEARLIDEPYVIEVSSPGVRRPLRTRAHFGAHVGERIEARVARGGRPAVVHGTLLSADETGLTLLAPPPRAAPADGAGAEEADAPPRAAAVPAGDGAAAAGDDAAAPAPVETRLAYGDVLSANLDPDFDIHALINADRRRRRDERREQRRATRAARDVRAQRRRRPPAE